MACTGPKGKADSRHDHKAATKGIAGAKRGKGKEKRRKKERKREKKEKRKGFQRGEPASEIPYPEEVGST